jgi:hypothetical protein
MNTNDSRQHKAEENRLRRQAKRKGFLLRRSHGRDPQAEDFGLYVLIGASRGNRLPGAAAARAAFRRGDGDTLQGIGEELRRLPR